MSTDVNSQRGIVDYGAYVPHYRLKAEEIASALGSGSGSGARSVSSHDEDTTSMGVEAARRMARANGPPADLFFATTAPAYADKTNAAAIHAALRLDPSAAAVDVTGSLRGGA